jgi:hypothetical protein
MQLDVFNTSQPARTPSDVQAATPILTEMLTAPTTWDQPKAGLRTWVPSSPGAGNVALVFQSPLGKKLLRYARGEKHFPLFGPSPAVYAAALAALPPGTHDQVWLTQNVYNGAMDMINASGTVRERLEQGRWDNECPGALHDDGWQRRAGLWGQSGLWGRPIVICGPPEGHT